MVVDVGKKKKIFHRYWILSSSASRPIRGKHQTETSRKYQHSRFDDDSPERIAAVENHTKIGVNQTRQDERRANARFCAGHMRKILRHGHRIHGTN